MCQRNLINVTPRGILTLVKTLLSKCHGHCCYWKFLPLAHNTVPVTLPPVLTKGTASVAPSATRYDVSQTKTPCTTGMPTLVGRGKEYFLGGRKCGCSSEPSEELYNMLLPDPTPEVQTAVAWSVPWSFPLLKLSRRFSCAV